LISWGVAGGASDRRDMLSLAPTQARVPLDPGALRFGSGTGSAS